MFISVLLNWLKSWLHGVGCSLLAAGLVGIVTAGSLPIAVAFCLVTGVVMILSALVVELICAIPDNPQGE